MLNKEPKTWSDITVQQFIDLNELNSMEFEIEDEYNVHLLSIITDTSIDEINQLEYDKFNELVEQFNFIRKLPTRQPSPIINTSAAQFHLVSFNELSIGEFIDLEYFFTNDYIVNLKTILAILYRQKTIHNSPLILDEFEDYGNWIFHREPLFEEICIGEVYGILPNYIKFRTDFFEKYDGLLGGPVEDDDEPIQGESIVSRAERIKENERQKSINKWGWDMFLYQLANNDVSRINEASKINLVQAFNSLSMKRELGV